MINEHDKALIEKANDVPYTEHWRIRESEAETEEGRKELHRIYMRKYHEEEWSAGML
jgi:hypothetical protein|nr:MAG TPA: hypothetical protein [Caudoviricetes sp.]